MVYYETGQGKSKKKYGVSIGAGPIKITSNPSLRKQVMNVKKSVRELQSKDELKYVDTFLNGSSITSTATLSLLNGMTQGDGVSNREGDSISPTSIQWRYRFAGSQTSIDKDVTARHMIFWDSQANGAAPAIGDVLDLATITTATEAPYKRQYQKRFKIIYDKRFVCHVGSVDPDAATTQIVSPVMIGTKKRSLSRVVKFRNAQNTGVITDIATNSLYSVWVTDTGVSAGVVTCGYRLYFKDD